MDDEERIIVIAVGVFVAIALCATVAVAYLSWQGSISWTIKEVQDFTVWDSATEGLELATSWVSDLGEIPLGTHIFNFYLENNGNAEITVVPTGTENGCSASWSGTGSYVLAVGSTRVQATLTLTITGAGSYSFSFDIAP